MWWLVVVGWLAVNKLQACSGTGVSTIPTAQLAWEDITCQIGEKTVLGSVSGRAEPGRLLAILGPSGSGKSTLLNTLCGQVPFSKGMRLQGRVLVDGKARLSNQKQAYIKQEDVFYSQLTVRETLMMAARLRLPRSMALTEKQQYVEDLMGRLGLAKVADTIVGDRKVRGISGGEKKRLNIACEIFGSPSLIFADEPTSGLDAFQAERVMQTLRQLAREGHTVVCSIHQPRGSIFSMFDDLLVLAEGRAVYQGPADQVASYWHEQGYSVPKNSNPAEFTIDLVSMDYSSPEATEKSRKRITALNAYAQKKLAGKSGGHHASPRGLAEYEASGAAGELAVPFGRSSNRRAASVGTQFRLLLARSWRQVNRSKFANMTRLVTNLASGVIFGCIFWRLGLGQTHINDRLGLLQVAVINTAMSTVSKTLTTFPAERGVVMAERSANTYGIGPYFLSKLIAELPLSAFFPSVFGAILYTMTGLNPSKGRLAKFLGVLTVEAFASSALGMLVGAITPNADSALALGPALMTVFILFSGFYINQSNIPGPLRWLKDISIIKWAFEALSVNELRGQKFLCDTDGRGPCIETGEQMLERVSFQDSTVRGSTTALARILGACYALTYASLSLKKPKYQPLLAPSC